MKEYVTSYHSTFINISYGVFGPSLMKFSSFLNDLKDKKRDPMINFFTGLRLTQGVRLYKTNLDLVFFSNLGSFLAIYKGKLAITLSFAVIQF